MKQSSSATFGIAALLTWIFVAGVSAAAWITHVIHCFQADQWGFLIAGAIAAPVAVVHGIGLWFGAF